MLDKKAEELFLKNEEEKKLKNQINNDLLKKKGRRQSSILQNIQQLNKKAKDVNEIGKNENTQKNFMDYTKRQKKDFYKKLTVLCTCFVEEYNLLFVSSFNNIISAFLSSILISNLSILS